MIETVQHDDVTAYRLSWWRSRLRGFSVTVYRVRDALIDTGYPRARDALSDTLTRAPVRGALLTHHHEDHAGNVQWLADSGVPLGMSNATEQILRKLPHIGLYRRITWGAMASLTGDIARFHDASLALIASPGHSPDHHVVFDHTTGTLFSGDLFLGVRMKIAHWYESPTQHVRSLRACIAMQPTRVFCAHRGLLPSGTAMLAAKADWLEDVIARVLALAAQGVDATTIREQLLGPLDSTHWISFGDYSADHIVRAILRDSMINDLSDPALRARE